ncbi:MAG TPA: peptidylprolyl isomerase [Spirochaetota bacterium]|nr:peptidylprolyl isomerase [Spirochaetota bacterium]HOS32593.1 peptidylprolyl isomerase [Spirochaetota bacterium]HOS54663.1 peptidylprolyl isomerase [Spirochaetota bacterium]HPK61257.1 peptidylprolyl isomerase [Spirochaetota bacterium]HQF77317.1 peptidylprolyl isomerase [Spirochaetota bacterium]
MSIKNNQKNSEKLESKLSGRNIFVTVVIAVIIVTFIFTGGPLLGMNDFIRDIGKNKIKNEDGSISIPDDAQSGNNSNNPNSYVGKVLNEKIQIGLNDEFNNQIQRVFQTPNMDPYMKYQYVRYFFDRALNKIIGMYNAKKMNITISKNYLVKEIGKRYFADADGDPDYNAMRKDSSLVNKYSKDVMLDLLYQNYITDFFQGLPVSELEGWDLYKMEKTKISLNYINLSNQDVDDKSLQSFYNEYKENYKKYKLNRLVFKDKKDAEAIVGEISADPTKFNEIGNKLKSEDKLINIVYDPDYSYLSDFESQELKDAIALTETGKVSQSIIQTSIGPIVFQVQDQKYGDLNEEDVIQKVRTDYIAKNFAIIEEQNKNRANNIYNLAKNKGLEAAAAANGVKVETMENAVGFMEYGFPNVNPDLTDDSLFIVKLFKGNKNDVFEPFRHENGYMVVSIKDKETPSMDKFGEEWLDLYKKYSSEKSDDLENDFYIKERKKHQVVDNFNYVFKIQDFMRQESAE